MSKRMVDDLITAMGIIKYNGCLIYSEGGGFRWGSYRFDTLQEAKDFIDKPPEMIKISESVYVGKNHPLAQTVTRTDKDQNYDRTRIH